MGRNGSGGGSGGGGGWGVREGEGKGVWGRRRMLFVCNNYQVSV